MASEDKFVKLNDGRTLAYTEHGDPSGKPVIFIHGNPGSRLSRHPDGRIVKNLGVRLITPDRPGYGLSDFQPKRSLLDFHRDIEQLTSALGIKKFAIFGVSAGGPYVAVCAYKFPEHITQAAIISGAAPLNRPNALRGMGISWQAAFKIGSLPEKVLQLMLGIQTRTQKRDPEKAVEGMAAILSQSDKNILKRSEFRSEVMLRVSEATRRGVRGWAREVKILVSPWGFDLEDIRIPVHLWYWEKDPAIPPQMGRYLESKIPNSIPHFLPEGGHLSIFDHWGEIIENLIIDKDR